MKIRCMAFLSLTALAPGLMAQTNPLQQGLELYQQARYEEALQQFSNARRLDPTNASIDNFIGITETRLGRMEQARDDFEKACRLNPKLAGSHINLGYNLLNAKQYDAAEKELRTGLALDAADAAAHYYLAVLYLTTSRSAQALPHIEPAISLLKNDVPAALLAIEAYLNAGNQAEARKLIALEDSRFTPEQERELATLLAARGMSDLAVDAWQKAIAANPTNPDLYLDCTRLLIELDRYDEAAAIVERGIALVPDAYPLTIRLGAIAMMSGDHPRARVMYEKAITTHPSLALGYIALAQSYMKDGKGADALKILADARNVVPRDFALEYVYGLALAQSGRNDEAQQAFATAEQMQPEVVEPHYQMGLLYMKKQSWKEAGDELERVLQLDPQNAPAYYQLSRAYQRLGQNDKAQQMAKQASLLTKTQREEALQAQQLRFGVPDHD